MTARMTESVVEEAALSWFEGLGYEALYGPDIAPGEAKQERASYGDVVLVERLLASTGITYMPIILQTIPMVLISMVFLETRLPMEYSASQ